MSVKLSLKAYRTNADKTQDDMAKMLNCHIQTYRKLEHTPKMMTVEQAMKVCEYLGIPFDVKIFA